MTAPVLATQGDTVRIHVGRNTLLVRVSGPLVPAISSIQPATTTPATWTVTMSRPTATMPVDPATFQSIDGTGAVQHLTVRGPYPGSRVQPGQVVTFQLHNRAFRTGEGRLRWIPTGHLAPVEWDFVAETH